MKTVSKYKYRIESRSKSESSEGVRGHDLTQVTIILF